MGTVYDGGCVKRGGFRKPTLERKPVPPYTLTRPVADAVQAFVAQPKDEAHRDRKLLDLAHRVNECQNCGKWSEHGCEPAHANGAEWSKGVSRKSHDFAHAALCHECHAWLDQGHGGSPCGYWPPNQKPAMWTRAHFRTFSHYWRCGWLQVSK